MLMHDHDFTMRPNGSQPDYIGKPVLVSLGILTIILLAVNSWPF